MCQNYNCGANGNQKKILFLVNIILKNVTEMIRELSCGVNGFRMTEITDILEYISTN